MTRTRELSLNSFPRSPFFVGFEDVFNRLEQGLGSTSSYPPYDIIKVNEDSWRIDLAVDGFTPDDIKIEFASGKLTVSGEKSGDTIAPMYYVHHGIGGRKFRQIFHIAETAVIGSADINNGILSISIDKIVPEHLKPRQIPIGGSSRQLLTENS
jgi:molecular chaperone IbpA